MNKSEENNLITCSIRPHLVSFLYKELSGEDQAIYEDKKVKLAKVCKSSFLGQLIDLFKINIDVSKTNTITGYSIFFRMVDNELPTGVFHEKRQKSTAILQLQKKDVVTLNNYLDSLYDTSLVEFVKGYTRQKTTKKSFVFEAVDLFMQDHDLYATETDPSALVQRYYRAIKTDHALKKIQNQTGNRSKYYNEL